MNKTRYFALLVALSTAFFAPNIMKGGVMLPLDILYHLGPFAASIPTELQRVHNPQLSDLAVMIYPWTESCRIFGESFPLWNPYSFCGSPLLANSQTGLLFPLSWVYRFLPLGPALLFLAIVKMSFCGIFAFLFYRNLNYHPQACLLGSISFMFAGATIVWFGYPASFSVVTLPFLFWSLQRYLVAQNLPRLACVALAYGLLFASGGVQTAFVISLASALYLIVAARGVRPHRTILYVGFAASTLLGFCLAAPQILPFMEYLREGSASHLRGSFGWKQYPWFTLLSWIMPRFFGDHRDQNFWGFSSFLGEAVYVGCVPLILATVGLLLRRRDRFYWGIVAVFLFGCLGLYSGWAQTLFKKIPLLANLDNNKLTVLICFGLVSLAVAGMNDLLESPAHFQRIMLIWLFAIAFWALLVTIGAIRFRRAVHELNLSGYLTREAGLQAVVLLCATAVLLLWRKGRLKPTHASWILLLIGSVDLFRLWMYYYPSYASEFLIPRSSSVEFLRKNCGDSRFFGLSGWIPPETSILYRLRDARGIDGQTPYRYYEVLGKIDPSTHDLISHLRADQPKTKGWTSSTLFYRYLDPYLNTRDPGLLSLMQHLDYWTHAVSHIDNPGLFSVLGVKYLIAPNGDPLPASAGFHLVHSSDADIWENPHCLPRAYISTDPIFVQNEQEALDVVSAPSFVDRKTAVICTSPESGSPRGQAGVNERKFLPARISLDAPDSVELLAESPRGGWLILSDLFYPGWEAWTDGIHTSIYQANYLFRAVRLQAGKHRVLFRYNPQSFRIGVALCLLSCGVLVGLLIYRPLRSGFGRRR